MPILSYEDDSTGGVETLRIPVVTRTLADGSTVHSKVKLLPDGTMRDLLPGEEDGYLGHFDLDDKLYRTTLPNGNEMPMKRCRCEYQAK